MSLARKATPGPGAPHKVAGLCLPGKTVRALLTEAALLSPVDSDTDSPSLVLRGSGVCQHSTMYSKHDFPQPVTLEWHRKPFADNFLLSQSPVNPGFSLFWL